MQPEDARLLYWYSVYRWERAQASFAVDPGRNSLPEQLEVDEILKFAGAEDEDGFIKYERKYSLNVSILMNAKNPPFCAAWLRQLINGPPEDAKKE